jgi:prepilin-type N-terminal cleavage/methylation domain-containing protein
MYRLIHRMRSEQGMTLLELVVAMSIMVVVAVIFLSVMVSVQNGVERQTDRSQTNDQARLALEQLDREIRSGNVLYDPTLEPCEALGLCLRIYTQTNANIRNPGNQCVQWKIVTATDQLQTRRWPSNWKSDPSLITPWRTIADNVVNDTVNPAFTLDPDPNKGGRTVVVKLTVNSNSRSGQNVSVLESLTGRNTEYGYPANVCEDIPL